MQAQIVGGGRKVLLLALVPLGALAVGCGSEAAVAPDQATPALAVSNAGAAASLQATPGRGIDAEFSRLASQIPGFGGMYYDKSGTLNVYVKSQPAEPGMAAAAVRSGDVVTKLRALGGRAVQDRLRRSSDVVVQAAAYDYGQLQGWKSRLTRIFRVPGVVMTDIDESQNRVRIGIAPNASQQAVNQAVARAGVPKEAVLVSRISPIKKMKTLLDKFRPVPAAVQIFFPAPSEGPDAAFICTLGFNAQLASNPGKGYFVTASHCSDIQGGNQHTNYFQPDPGNGGANANRIAIEFLDPNYGNPGGLCIYEGARCRLSDALLAHYRDGVQSELGKIARTTFGLGRIGSLEIDKKNPRWDVIGQFPFPFEGEIANKVGRSSGWTSGPVILTCADFGVSGTDIVQICQDAVLAGVRPGDSGSPVFERADDTSSDVFLTGVLWGGGTLDGAPIFVFSAMENIQFELGDLITEASASVASAK